MAVPRRLCASLVLVLCATLVGVVGVWLVAGGGAWFGGVDVLDVRVISDTQVELRVDSCNGSPEAEIEFSASGEYRVSVQAFRRPLSGSDGCAGLLLIDLPEPLETGGGVVVDENSGVRFVVRLAS